MVFGIKKPQPPKKTYDEVFADLVKSLSEKANKSLSNPISLPSQPTLSDLEQIFKQITYDTFANKFSYQFNAQSTVPPSLAPGKRIITTFESFYKVEDDNKQNAPPPDTSSGKKGTTDPPFTPIPDDRQPLSTILDDFKNQITGLPDWIQDKAQQEIVGRLDTFFTGSGGLNDWTTDVNTPTYDQTNKYANSIRLDSVFVRLSGSNEETGVKAALDTVYCVGIYYEVVSAATIAKKNLWKSLYEQAGSLLNVPPSIPDNPTPGQLEALLIWYRDNKMFQHDYGFPFKGTPDGLISDLGRPTHLFIIEDDDYSKLSQEIQQSVLSKVKMPTWANSALNDLGGEITNLAKSAPSSGGWLPVKYEKAPPTPTKAEPAVIIKANLVYCNLVAPARKDVTYRAIYFCGVFYTAPSAKETVSQELISAVYQSALRLVDNAGNKPDQPSRGDLDNLLYQALSAKFQSKFGYPYDEEKTAPKDKVGSTLYYGKVSFDSKARDQAAAEEVTENIMSALKLSSTNDAKLQKAIYDDILLKTKRALEADPLSVPLNTWDEMSHDREYSYSEDSRNPLVGKAVLYYCNASVLAQNTTLQRSFIYFAGVFYEIAPGDEW